jgi:uncharacterized protein YegP (UPF0339 family)
LAMKFTAGNSDAGNPTWWLRGGNGELVAWAGEILDSVSNAKRAAEAFKVGAASASYEIYLDASSKWRWRAVRGGNKVAAPGESFASQSNAQRAADNVRDNAGSATGPE